MFSKICELFSSDVNAFAKCPGLFGWFETILQVLTRLCGLCTAIVTQLPFVSMELSSNKFEVQLPLIPFRLMPLSSPEPKMDKISQVGSIQYLSLQSFQRSPILSSLNQHLTPYNY